MALSKLTRPSHPLTKQELNIWAPRLTMDASSRSPTQKHPKHTSKGVIQNSKDLPGAAMGRTGVLA